MKVRITKKGAYALIALGALGTGLFAWNYSSKHPELFQRFKGEASTKIEGVNIPMLRVSNEAPVSLRPVYSVAQARAENVGTWRHKGIAWNGQIGLIYANGGANTATGSLMNRYGISMNFERQDDYSALAGELLKFAQAYARGEKDPRVGSHSVIIMGDAGAGFAAGIQPELTKLGLHLVTIGAPGRSFGEDKCMGPPEWFDNPEKAKGGVISGVLRDGDIHICLVWAQANGIKVNPDPKTWDPGALNFYATSSFTEADQAYISNRCESRPVVIDGKPTGKSQRVCVQGTATWTPGDVNVVKSKGGVVTLLSTRENGGQMFSTIFVIKEWARDNPATVTNFLKAALDGSTEVARDRSKLRQAACLSAQVWREQDCAYWERYYDGRVEDVPGTGGRQVRLGGSQALGLASNLQYFLPGPDGQSVYDRVYRTFGDLDRRLYPNEMPEFPRAIVDTFFLEKIRDSVGTAVGQGDVFGRFTGSESQQVAARSYSINFEVGSARILPSSYDDLEQILNNVTVGSGLAIEVNGFASTDGDPGFNQRLSEQRAQAVRDWLVERAARGLITPERVRATGYGAQADRLVCNSSTEDCHRRNRRVEIRLLSGDA